MINIIKSYLGGERTVASKLLHANEFVLTYRSNQVAVQGKEFSCNNDSDKYTNKITVHEKQSLIYPALL